MKKYVGIIKLSTETMVGVDFHLLSMFSDDIEDIEEWKMLYPKSQLIIVENNSDLQKFFEEFEDNMPITEKDKEAARKLYKKLMKGK